jgi:anti-sigma factor RsiW
VSAHLGDQVAAFVDGQLDYARRERALDHLRTCARCRDLVEQERWVKTRVQTLPGAEPSANLLSALTRVSVDDLEGDLEGPTAPFPPWPSTERRWLLPQDRLRRSSLFLAGAGSLAAGFIGVAYAIGSAAPAGDPPVSPPVGQFSAQFAGSQPMPFSDPAMDAIPALGSRSSVGGR